MQCFGNAQGNQVDALAYFRKQHINGDKGGGFTNFSGELVMNVSFFMNGARLENLTSERERERDDVASMNYSIYCGASGNEILFY